MRDFADRLTQVAGAERISSETVDLHSPEVVNTSLEVAQSTATILEELHRDFRKQNTGALRRAKNYVIGKLSNIVRNTVEKPLLSQQKYNQQVLFLLNHLQQEVEELKSQLKDSKGKSMNNKSEKQQPGQT